MPRGNGGDAGADRDSRRPLVHRTPGSLHWRLFRRGALLGQPGQALIIGPAMGAILLVPIGGILGLTALFFNFSGLLMLALTVAYALYVAALGTLGAAVGGSSVRRQAAA